MSYKPIDNRDKILTENVKKQHEERATQGVFETISEVYSRLPLPRIQKDSYVFVFEDIKQKVQIGFSKQNILKKITQNELKQIEKIQLKNIKFTIQQLYPSEEDIKKQTLKSNNPITKSLVYLRQQNFLNMQQRFGNQKPFCQDDQQIDINAIQSQIPNIRTLLQHSPPLRRIDFQFKDQNSLQLRYKFYPHEQQLSQRAQILAKSYLLKLYIENDRKLKSQQKLDESLLEKQRQINKIQQQNEAERLKEGQRIDQSDITKQVFKILQLLQKKMNKMAYQQYTMGRGERATAIKRSLQKLKQNLNNQKVAKQKLKMLIAYKHKKGW